MHKSDNTDEYVRTIKDQILYFEQDLFLCILELVVGPMGVDHQSIFDYCKSLLEVLESSYNHGADEDGMNNKPEPEGEELIKNNFIYAVDSIVKDMRQARAGWIQEFIMKAVKDPENILSKTMKKAELLEMKEHIEKTEEQILMNVFQMQNKTKADFQMNYQIANAMREDDFFIKYGRSIELVQVLIQLCSKQLGLDKPQEKVEEELVPTAENTYAVTPEEMVEILHRQG